MAYDYTYEPIKYRCTSVDNHKLRKEDKNFYIPWSFDYRGRAYPIPSFLTPQDTDFGKSLLRFSEESEITEDGKKW